MANAPPPVDEKARREARLAEALRSNLRRRKTGAAPKPKPSKPAEPEA